MWQLCSMETMHPVHKSSATVTKHQLNLRHTPSNPFVLFLLCVLASSRSVRPHWVFGLCKNGLTQGWVQRRCVLLVSAWVFPLQCERGGKGPSGGLWSIDPRLRLYNHLLVMSTGIKELFIHSLCWAHLIDYWYSPYVSFLSVWQQHALTHTLSLYTHKVKLDNNLFWVSKVYILHRRLF